MAEAYRPIRLFLAATLVIAVTAPIRQASAQTAVTEGVKQKEKSDACRMVRLGADMIPVARTGIAAGQESFGDMAKQSLEVLDQLEPYAADQVKTFCGAS